MELLEQARRLWAEHRAEPAAAVKPLPPSRRPPLLLERPEEVSQGDREYRQSVSAFHNISRDYEEIQSPTLEDARRLWAQTGVWPCNMTVEDRYDQAYRAA